MDTKQINAVRVPVVLLSCTILILWSCLIGIQLMNSFGIGKILHVVSALSQPINIIRQQPKGSAAKPLQKQKIIIAGCGGYLGGITFGYLQRASSLYGTGIGPIRCIGATSDTSIRLNRILNKHFTLAQADESYIKLTDLTSIHAITNRMIGYDTLILGANMFVQRMVVTANTYEKSPNDKAWEIYWDQPKGSFTDFDLSLDAIEIRDQILTNFVRAAQEAQLKHIFLVVDKSKLSDLDLLSQIKQSNIPFTCLCSSKLTDNASRYAFQDGIINDLQISSENDMDITTNDATEIPLCREDLAAICVQAVQSLDWNRSQRYIKVTSNGEPATKVASLVGSSQTPKRIDQQWCINSSVIEEKLNLID